MFNKVFLKELLIILIIINYYLIDIVHFRLLIMLKRLLSILLTVCYRFNIIMPTFKTIVIYYTIYDHSYLLVYIFGLILYWNINVP